MYPNVAKCGQMVPFLWKDSGQHKCKKMQEHNFRKCVGQIFKYFHSYLNNLSTLLFFVFFEKKISQQESNTFNNYINVSLTFIKYLYNLVKFNYIWYYIYCLYFCSILFDNFSIIFDFLKTLIVPHIAPINTSFGPTF